MGDTPFAAATAGALADIAAANATPEVVPETPAPVAPVSVAQEPAAPAPPPTPAPEPQVEEEEIVWNGRTIRLPKDEVRVLAQKGYDYTQKTQTLAEIRQQVEREKAQFEREKQEIVEFLKDPHKVQQYYAALAQQSGLSTNPDEIPTMAQLQQAMQAQAEVIQRQTQAEIAKTVQKAAIELETKRVESDYSAEVERSLAAAAAQNPILAEFYEPGDLSDQLKKDAWAVISSKIAQNPEYVPSNAEMRSFILGAAKRRADKAQAKLQDHAKMAAVRAAKVQTTGIEPPGGGAPTPPTPQKLKLGSPELRAAVLADLEAAARAKAGG